MQILYIIGDLSPNSIERQLVEIIQDFDNITQTEIYDGSQNIALADSVWFIVCGNIDNIKRIIQDNTSTFSEKICTLSGLGGVDGSIDKVRQVHSFDILLNLPDELAELHYEIDALSDDNEITDEQIERALLELINRKW